MTRGVYRGDLLRIWGTTAPELHEEVAACVGFERGVAAEQDTISLRVDIPPAQVSGPTPPPIRLPAQGTSTARIKPVPFWILERVRYAKRDKEEKDERPSSELPLLEEQELRGMLLREPLTRHVPLVAWPRLVRPLSQRAAQRQLRELDVERYCEQRARGELRSVLPRREARVWPTRLVVLLDRSHRLTPFWGDQDEVCRRLENLCGSLDRRVIESSPRGAILRNGRVHRARLADLGSGDTVLALSDLGSYADPATARTWLRAGSLLNQQGAKLLALLPVPLARWHRDAARLWQAVLWDRAAMLGASDPSEIGEVAAARRAEQLLRLLAPAVRIEPGLLRELRFQLAANDSYDVGTEADAWQHDAVQHRHHRALGLDPEKARAWQEEFPATSLVEQRWVIDALRSWHKEAYPIVWCEELLSCMGGRELLAQLGVQASELEEQQALLRRLAEGLSGEGWSGERRETFASWASILERRLSARVFGDAGLRASLAQLCATSQSLTPRTWVRPELVGESLRSLPRTATRAFELQQVAKGIEIVPSPSSAGTAARARSFLSRSFRERSAVVLQVRTQHRARWQPCAPFAPTPISCDEVTPLSLETDRQRLDFGVLTLPDWASAIGRDRYGLWCEFTIGNVVQRMRYIPPGRFRMGSPESEAGRWDEGEGPVHQVTLTQGFWLAETPCTQELWMAVLGENPSTFQSPTRPVEQVSWHDAKKFIARANARNDGLALRLPTEAEWEYACRAGTTTSTYAGEMEIRGENHGTLLNEIAWYGGNSGQGFELAKGEGSTDWPNKEFEHAKAGTRPVGLKRANPWGLRDMLGNVWEWCEDWFGDYDADPVEDPPGSPQGSDRVLRGGAWYSDARSCRAADRGVWPPDGADRDVGFRLARGQGLSSPEPAEPESASSRGEPQSRRGTRRAGGAQRERARRVEPEGPPESAS